MIDVIKQQFKEGMPAEQMLNLARESLQIICLKIFNEKDFFSQLAFVGGTALRILFNLRRFSEDLDFSLIKNDKYNLGEMNSQLTKSFNLYGLPLETKVKEEGSVHNVTLKFTGLLKKLGLSALPEQKLSIRLEIDTNPPPGWQITDTIVNKIYMFNIVHYDLASLYATKLHACFFRKFIKGRDFYDFVWYLGGKIKPNYILLNNAIKQTQGLNPGLNEDNFRQFLLENVKKVDFDYVKKDVERFLEDKNELSIFELGAIRNTIEAAY